MLQRRRLCTIYISRSKANSLYGRIFSPNFDGIPCYQGSCYPKSMANRYRFCHGFHGFPRDQMQNKNHPPLKTFRIGIDLPVWGLFDTKFSIQVSRLATKHAPRFRSPERMTRDYWDETDDEGQRIKEEWVEAEDREPLDKTRSAKVCYSESTLSLLRRLDERERGDRILDVVNEWIAEGNQSSKESYVCAIARLKELSRWHDALQLSEWMMNEHPSEVDLSDYILRLDLTAKVRTTTEAEKFFYFKFPAEYRKTDIAHVTLMENYLLKNCMHKATGLMKRMRKQGLFVSPVVFNKMLVLCQRKGKEDRIPIFLQQMQEAGVSPDIETYNILLDIKSRKGNVDAMDMIYRKLQKENKLTPNSQTYCILAAGYISVGLVYKAEAVLKAIENDEQFIKTRDAHDRMIQLYADLSKVKDVEHVWQVSRSFPNIPSESYVNVMAAFGKLGEIQKAESVLKELKISGEVFREEYDGLLSVYAAHGLTDEAEKLMQEMVEKDCKPRSRSYQHLIFCYKNAGMFDKAVEVLKRLLSNTGPGNSRPTFDSVLLILNVYADRADVINAEAFIQDIKREGYTRKIEAYNALLRTYLNAGKHAYRFVQRMAADRAIPNAETNRLLDEMKLKIAPL